MKPRRPAIHGDRDARSHAAFTLLELLVVVGLIAAMSFLLLGGLAAGGRSAALQAGQATFSNLVVAARSRAVASSRSTRLLVQHDPQSPIAAERYLRFMALEELRQGQWQTLQTISLPHGIHVLPHENRIPAGLLAEETAWRKTDGKRLHSSALFRPLVSRPIDSPIAEQWAELVFSAHGTTATSGQIVVAAGRAAQVRVAGDSPVVLDNAEMVRGVQLSVYGLAVTIDGREGF